MENGLRISAKNLGAVALPSFCLRCFWIQQNVSGLPYQIFPGIFSSIDSYTKKVVHGWFDRNGNAPPWLKDVGPIVGYKDPPHHSKFRILDAATGILLTGTPDAIYTCKDGSFVIADYKTARYTAGQDELLPMYDVQLNVYARIGEAMGFSPVSGLALIYMEPVTDDVAAVRGENHHRAGFRMEFSALVHQLEIKPKSIGPLLKEVRRIADLSKPPRGNPDCKNCKLVDELVVVANA